jgi:HAD superfamily hydrolase (TIGR01509 family)
METGIAPKDDLSRHPPRSYIDTKTFASFNCLLRKPFYALRGLWIRGATMRVEAVLFDLFDTLLLIKGEVYYPPCLRRLFEFLVKNGVNVSFEDFNRVYFEVRDKLYSESRKSLEEPHFNVRVSQTLHRLGYSLGVSDPVVAGATMAFADEFTRYVSLDTDTLDVLEKLHGKYKLGVVSNFAIPECAWKLVENFGLKRFFDVVVISGDINKRKPSPEIFEKALKGLGVDASRAVFVGDMLDLDVVGPKRVGMKTVLIERRRPMEENVDVKPDRIITRLSGLLVVLEDC